MIDKDTKDIVPEEKVTAQKLSRVFSSKISKAITYFCIVDSLNNLKLTRKQIELLAFTSIRGTISSLSAKEEFVKQFGSSVDSINNMISKLYKKKLLVKQRDGKIKINKLLNVDFESSEIVLNITFRTKLQTDES